MSKKIIARLQNGNYSIIFNQGNPGFLNMEESYNDPDITNDNSFEFNPDRKLEKDEWYFVTPSIEQKSEIIQPYLNTISSSDGMNPITAKEYPFIRAICLIEKNNIGSERIILTRVFPRFFTLSKKILKWHDGPKLEKQHSSVDFTGSIDAFWNGSMLYFKSYADIKLVFSGLENFYRIATESEKNDFLQKDFFECSNGYQNVSVKTRNLRKIAAILDNIDWSDSNIKQKYIDYAKKYPKLNVGITENGKLKIDSNKDITNIMNILEERIYTTPITGEEREANSITKLN